MVSNSNTIADLSGKLLELFSKLPHYLIIGMDKRGKTVFSNEQQVSLSENAVNVIQETIEQYLSADPSWRNELDTNHYLNNPELSLKAFCLQTDENNAIHYAFLVEVQEPSVSKGKPINVYMENEPVVELLNEVIGLSNNLMKKAKERPTHQFAQFIYDKAWKTSRQE